MKQKSYRIKHDFLFEAEDTEILIPQFDSNHCQRNEIKLSDVLKAKDDDSFKQLISDQMINIVVDDIGKCNNPASERYKQFIVRCVYRKLISLNIVTFI